MGKGSINGHRSSFFKAHPIIMTCYITKEKKVCFHLLVLLSYSTTFKAFVRVHKRITGEEE